MLIQRFRDGLDDVVRHANIDFASQFDKASAEVPLLGLPRQIEGIYGNAMTAQAWPGIEGMKAKGLGGGGGDYFPDVQSHSQG